MFKKIVVGGVIALACLWVAKKTQLTSYASTVFALGKAHVRSQIPRDLELARVQNEIEQLDRDYQGLLGPIAERMAGVKKLEREVAAAKANQQEQRDSLLAMTKSIEAKESQVSFQGSSYTLDQAKVKLARGFATFKKLETHLASKEKLLDAENKNLAATRDQLDKLVVQKREFEIRLAQLDAEEATLRLARIQAPLVTDEGRVADIKNSLDLIEHGQAVEQNKHVLQQQYGSKIADAQPTEQAHALDLDEIRDYLQGKAAAGTKLIDNN